MLKLADCDTRPLDGRKLHVCDVCKQVNVWDADWAWYGPLEPEWPEDIIKTCSDKCRASTDVERMYTVKVAANKKKRKGLK